MAGRAGRAGGGATVPRHNQRLGGSGEDLAAAWYTRRGYEVVARNWRCREGEIDLVVHRAGVLVFCEVKARTSTRFGLPAEAVTPAKQRRLRLLAARFLADRGASPARRGSGGIRFDVASVLAGTVEVIEAAF